MANVIIQIYGIRTVEDARMVIDMGGHHIGVSYGKIKRTPGQLTCEKAKEIFEGVQPEAVKVGLTVAEDIDEITENLKVVCPDVLHLSGDIEGVKRQIPRTEDHAGNPRTGRRSSGGAEGYAVYPGLRAGNRFLPDRYQGSRCR